MSKFELIVLGCGPAGMSVATDCAKAGMEVALAAPAPFGSTCALYGCNPKKLMFAASDSAIAANRLSHLHNNDSITLDWAALRSSVLDLTDSVPGSIENSLQEAGVTLIRGSASLTSPESIEVEGREYHFDKLHIATGARARPLDIPGESLAIDNEAFFFLPAIGKRVALIGGGYIGVEFAGILASCGCEVVLYERGRRVLKHLDEALSSCVAKNLEELGVDLEFQVSVRAIEEVSSSSETSEYTLHSEVSGAKRQQHFDTIIHAAGRIPNLRGLALERGMIDHEEASGILVNDYLQSTSNPRVFAGGDVVAAAGKALTPIAAYHARVVTENIQNSGSRELEKRITPTVVFSSPPVASVGMLAEDAREAGIDFDVRIHDSSTDASAKFRKIPHSVTQILLEKKSKRLLGAHLVGVHSEEVIHLCSLAIEQGLTSDALTESIYAYPSASYDLRSAFK